MHTTQLLRARAGDEEAFQELTDPYRRELELHCYRILGSLQDAEDLLQETLLAAWRSLDQFEERASVRAWLYRIATNRCLNALRDAGRRPQQQPAPMTTRNAEPVWLQPYPDVLLEAVPDPAPSPEARYESRESISLAFVSGLQHLPPQQRAALVLRDVLGFRAAEAATMLDTSEAAVNSTLQRARSAFETRLSAIDRERATLPASPRERELAGRFADAFQSGDVDGVVALLTEDAAFTMPPQTLEVHGRPDIARFLATVPAGGELERFRLVATRANGQPAFGFYLRDRQCPIARASGIMVLTIAGDQIAAITTFHDTSVFPQFGLPRTLRDDQQRA
jgi:RNA polymerase sigma-70 factor (TIGR02960 family)